MIARLSAIILGLMLFCRVAHAESPLGVGLVLGGPSGLGVTAEYVYSKEQSLVGNLALGSYYRGLQIDHLWHQNDVIQFSRKSSDVDLTTYIGAGVGIYQFYRYGRYFYHRDNREPQEGSTWQLLSARMPLGISLNLRHPPLKFFAEAAPTIYIYEGAFLALEIALGVRYYF